MPPTSGNVYLHAVGFTAVIVAILAVRYPDRAVFDEHRDGIPFKKGWPIVGRLPQILKDRDRIHEHFLESFTSLRSLTVTSSSLGVPRSIITIDPQNIEHVLKDNFQNYVKGPQLNDAMGEVFGHGIFNSNGERWKFQRKVSSHIFNVKNFRQHYTDVFIKELDLLFDKVFDIAVEKNEAIDFQDMMFRYMLDSFMLIGFGTPLNSITEKDNIPFVASFDECQRNGFKRFINPFWKMTEKLASIFAPWRTPISQHIDILHEFANDIVNKRRQQANSGEINSNDLLCRFMETRNEKGELLSNQELRDMVLNFMIAGRDTTAQSLSWIFYMLTTNPHVEKKLLKEIDQTLSDDLIKEPELLYDAIKSMVYAHAISYEALRLYPPVPTNQKYALGDDIWPDGTVIKQNDYIYWCPWAQGRSEAIWGHDAQEFKPERWITVDGKLRRESQGQWPAFHAGPRTCLGQNLAILQTVITMSFIIRRYKLSLVPDQNIAYGMSLTLPMKNGLKVFIDKR